MEIVAKLTPEQYATERAICDKANATMRALWKGWERGGAIPQEVCDHPDYKACDNAMRGRVEQFEILRDEPEEVFAYIASKPYVYSNYKIASRYEVTVWTGHAIGSCNVTGKWRVRNGWVSGHHYSYHAKIGKREYIGRGPGPGMYVRLRETAESKRKNPRA